MKFFTKNLCGITVILACAFAWGDGFAASAANPRGGASNSNSAVATNRGDAHRGATANTDGATTARTARARPTASRAAANMATTTTVAAPLTQNVSARTGRTAARVATTGAVTASGATKSRAASINLSRSLSGKHAGTTTARSALPGVSRAGVSRATAVFTDISKIGGGYATCRDAYATCMDQFCANANDTYRRCFCSERFTEFRDTEDALDQAILMLQQFQDNNLNAVDKTAAEVNAMYTASEGEAAIKKDVSASAQLLNNISDLLSGKKKASSYSGSQGTSLGVLSLDFSTSMDDIWGGDGSSLFGGDSGPSMTDLEGDALFNAANKQCLQVMGDSCENQAVLNMSKSAYGIMIAQDCNAYQKSVDTKKESVTQTVRTAEKYLREARLEEYRSHNSADVNECITSVRNAMLGESACGPNYVRCLDYTGAYINQTTGEPIYSPRLFQLTDVITLGGIDSSQDVLAQNPRFNEFLDSKKMFATTALDSCRGIADTVWTEFKRTALIEIAQAQDEKIEEVKMSCVSTMAECYDTQSSALKDFDTNTAKVSGAMSAYAARAMCEDKVVACAALYGDTSNCSFKDGKLTSASGDCGLGALLAFVDTVDSVRVAEGCATALETRLTEDCTPTSGKEKYPWNCRNKTTDELKAMVTSYANQYCANPSSTDTPESFAQEVSRTSEKLLADLQEQLTTQMREKCEELDGYWMPNDGDAINGSENASLLRAFYTAISGGNMPSQSDDVVGFCYENTTRIACLNYNDTEKNEVSATYDAARDECTFSEEWFKARCTMLGQGYWENSTCYVKPNNN